MKILLLGANGQLGKELKRQLTSVGSVTSFTRESLDITNHQLVRNVVRTVCPNIIINAAAYTAVDKAETDFDCAYAVNAEAVANLAKIAKQQNLWMIHYSTDYVFDGTKSTPYIEDDTPNPINTYGSTKLGGETAIAAANCQHLIFRTTWVIGKDGHNFAKIIMHLASERDCLQVIHDQIGVPTSPLLISKVTIDAILAIKQGNAWPQGIYHLAPKGKSNWYEIAKTLINYAEQQNIQLRTHSTNIHAITTADYLTIAQRPLNSQLDTHKLRSKISFDLPHWKDDFLVVAREIIKKVEDL